MRRKGWEKSHTDLCPGIPLVKRTRVQKGESNVKTENSEKKAILVTLRGGVKEVN